MTYREMMIDNNENLSWCRPYIHDRVQFSILEGNISGLMIDGDDVDPNPESIRTAAQIVNPDYSEYEGWTDLHILLDGDAHECACCDCPWFDVCSAMDEEVEY